MSLPVKYQELDGYILVTSQVSARVKIDKKPIDEVKKEAVELLHKEIIRMASTL